MTAELINNRYRIIKSIGEGGMATVYLAVDEKLNKEVAIKILKKDLVSDEVALERFKREAKTITSTSHTNIVEVFDVGQDGDKYYIVMEYVRGKTLKQLVRQRGVINIHEAVNIMKQLVSAVSHAHKSGIIHRDIKSQNVLIKDDGIVKLSDFGIAIMGDNNNSQLTQAQTVVGSVHYMAPELAAGQQATAQSDIYALGIVFYEMLTGNVPFKGDTAVEIALKHMHDPIPNVREFNPTIHQSVENIVIRATAKKKENRYSSAVEMYNDLVTCLDITRNTESKLKFDDLDKKKSENKNGNVKPIMVKKIRRRKVDVFPIILTALLAFLLVIMLMALSGVFIKTERVIIPDVNNWNTAEAQEKIIGLGLAIENVEYAVSDDVEKGKIVSIFPYVGTEVSKGSYVSIVVSLGKNFVVDNYVGKKYEVVKKQLESEDFIVNYVYIEPNGYDYGTIVSQDIVAGTIIAPNSIKKIYFEIADHPSFIISGNLIGKPLEEAKSELEKMGAVVKLEKLPIENNLDEQGNYIHEIATVVKMEPEINTYYVQTDGQVLTIYYY